MKKKQVLAIYLSVHRLGHNGDLPRTCTKSTQLHKHECSMNLRKHDATQFCFFRTNKMGDKNWSWIGNQCIVYACALRMRVCVYVLNVYQTCWVEAKQLLVVVNLWLCFDNIVSVGYNKKVCNVQTKHNYGRMFNSFLWSYFLQLRLFAQSFFFSRQVSIRTENIHRIAALDNWFVLWSCYIYIYIAYRPIFG